MICCNCKREISKNYGYNTIGCYCSSCAMQMGLTVEQIILNLQSQLAEKDKEIERLKKYETIYYLNQLQASNEDIDKFKQNQIQQSINISDLLKDNTKQVCEKIRKWGDKHFNWVGDGTGYDGQDYNEMIGFNNAITELYKFLDQIDKGE